MTYTVECYAGSTYPEQPRAFIWEDIRYSVSAVLQRRREIDGIGFMVKCSPENKVFNLFYNCVDTSWQIQPNETIKAAETPR